MKTYDFTLNDRTFTEVGDEVYPGIIVSYRTDMPEAAIKKWRVVNGLGYLLSGGTGMAKKHARAIAEILHSTGLNWNVTKESEEFKTRFNDYMRARDLMLDYYKQNRLEL